MPIFIVNVVSGLRQLETVNEPIEADAAFRSMMNGRECGQTLILDDETQRILQV